MNQEGEGTRRLQSLLELSLEIVTLKMITLALHKSFVTVSVACIIIPKVV